jgi:hypothetical protein
VFNKQINHLIGKDPNRLFGMENVSVKKSEVYVGAKKGVSCSVNNENETWALGDTVLNNLVNVKIISLDSKLFRYNIFLIYCGKKDTNVRGIDRAD